MQKFKHFLAFVAVVCIQASPVIADRLKDLIPESADLSSGTEQSFTGSGSSNQSNSLSGLISVHVVRVFGNGNLEILGQKKLTLNNGDEYIRVSGIVRPRDIS